MDEIIISGLKVFARHGVYDFEKRDGQSFLVNAVLETDFSRASEMDDLAETTDYCAVCSLIEKFLGENTFDLIETAAAGLSREILLRFENITAACVEICKPQAPIGQEFKSISARTRCARHRVFLSLGSNMGDKKANLDFALARLGENECCRVVRVSEFVKTKPYGFTGQDEFLNAAAQIETILSPHALLKLINGIEADAGRKRELRWGPRTLDVDILLFDDLVCCDERLVIPHPDMKNRRFVLEPLSMIAPDVIHPVCKKSVREMLKDLD